MKFRIVDRPDGSREFIRILDQSALRKWKKDAQLGCESSVVWLQPMDCVDFVRMAVLRDAHSRRGPITHKDAEWLLGYSTLTEDAPTSLETQGYRRRVFYLKSSDSCLNMNQFPADALDPKTIFPGIAGQPPNLIEVERGYPWYLCRGGLQSDLSFQSDLPLHPDLSLDSTPAVVGV